MAVALENVQACSFASVTTFGLHKFYTAKNIPKLRLQPGHRWGRLQSSPDPIARFKGGRFASEKEKQSGGGRREGEKGEREGRNGEEIKGVNFGPCKNSCGRPWLRTNKLCSVVAASRNI